MILLLWCIGTIALVNGQLEDLKIIDGDTAQPAQFPFVGRLFYGNLSECTVSIIHERWALTAAHCIYPVIKDPQVLVGSVNSNADSDGKFYAVEKMIRHEKFDFKPPALNHGREYIVNDIALLRFNETVVFTPRVKAIPVPDSNVQYRDSVAYMAAFGLHSIYAKSDGQLRFAAVDLLDDDHCTATYTFVADKHLCAVSPKTACPTDSGGPLFYNGNGGLVIGIITSIVGNNPNCVPGPVSQPEPMLFTKVGSYKSWIQEKLAEFNDKLPGDEA